MTIKEAIEHFPEQFVFEPVIEHRDHFPRKDRFVVLGMGGSHLAADILLTWKPSLPLTIHSDYGLPAGSWADALFIASSYSGNTEEVLTGCEEARAKGYAVVAISVGGLLLRWAKENDIPFVRLPLGLQPRAALGLSVRALLKVMGELSGLDETGRLAKKLRPKSLEPAGKALAQTLRGKTPIIYASNRNRSIAYNWKIKLNETGKIPAFSNVLPELNHNEMTGFDVQPATSALSQSFHWLLLRDTGDHPRLQRRMVVLREVLEKRGLPVTSLELVGASEFEKIFSSLLLADWCAWYTAEQYGVEATEVPMLEEFKKLIAN